MAALVLLIDQLSKWWAVHTLTTRTIDVVWTLRFNLIGNTGASFSRFGGQGPLISLGAVAVVCAVLWLSPVAPSRLGSVALGMILGGALGNLVDRAFRGDAGFLHGAVIDFIDFQWWPVFNVADMAVVIGALLLAFSFLRAPDGRPRRQRWIGLLGWMRSSLPPWRASGSTGWWPWSPEPAGPTSPI